MSSEIEFLAIQPSETVKGASEEARFVDGKEKEGRASLRSSVSIGAVLRIVQTEIKEVIEDCSRPNWNGYNSAPAKRLAIVDSFRFADVIPLGLPAPAIGAEPDGDITFEWYKDPDWVLSVSVDDKGNLHYAALLGPDRAYGTEAFVGILPKRILDLIYLVTI